MQNKLLKSLAALSTAGLLVASLSACDINSQVAAHNLAHPNYSQIVNDYQYIFGGNQQQLIASQKKFVERGKEFVPAGLIPDGVWNYYRTHVITPLQVELLWSRAEALSKVTSGLKGFTDADVEKIINNQLAKDGKPKRTFSEPTLKLVRMVGLSILAQQAKLPEAKIQEIAKQVEEAAKGEIKPQFGSLDQQSTQILSSVTQGQLQIPVAVPNVARGVILQGYENGKHALDEKVNPAK